MIGSSKKEENYKEVYPLDDRIQTVATTSLAETRRTKAPAVLAEVAYHDNEEDATWIKHNIDRIARNFTDSIIEYLNAEGDTDDGIPAQVVTMGSRLNMRSSPSITSPIIRKIPNGSSVTVLERQGNWYKIVYGGQRGYVAKRYLAFL